MLSIWTCQRFCHLVVKQSIAKGQDFLKPPSQISNSVEKRIYVIYKACEHDNIGM